MKNATISQTSQSERDRRLPAALLLGCGILTISLFQVEWWSAETSDTFAMTLRCSGTELHWQPLQTVDNPDNCRYPDAAPFFFQPVPINLASHELLMMLPRIGDGMAGRIEEFRTNNGPIKNKHEFMQIRGIGPARYRALEKSISFQQKM